MGQSPSSHSRFPPGFRRRFTTLSCCSSSTLLVKEPTGPIDYTSFLPDDLLAEIFQRLDSGDRKRCSLVCRRWMFVEGQSRYHLTLNAQVEIFPYLCPMFARYLSVMRLTLHCSRNSLSINDYGLMIISAHCPRLIRLKLRGCNNITGFGMANVAKYCRQLKQLLCEACILGVQTINRLLNDCSSLEELSFSRLRLHNFNETTTLELIGPGAAASSLKCIHLNDVSNGFFLQPLIAGSKKLQSLKLIRCSGEWDSILESMTVPDNNIMEVHLERVHVSDIGLSALSNCPNLQILHIVKTPDCTDAGVTAVAGSCLYLRKLVIDGWKMDRIGDEGLIAVARNLVHLNELILVGVNATTDSLRAIGINCKKIERLALCGCDTVSDRECFCIAFKCDALQMIGVRCCPVGDLGIQAFAYGCPNLLWISVEGCEYVSGGIGDWLRARRGSLEVFLDNEPETVNATTNESGAQEEPVEVPAVVSHGVDAQSEPLATRSNRRSFFKRRFGVFSRRGLVACAFGRRSGRNSSSSGG